MSQSTTRRQWLLEVPLITAAIVRPFAAAADVGGAEAAGKRSKVIAACTKHWPDNSGDCSAFVRAVSKDLGFSLDGDANHIYDLIAASPWTRIGVGPAASTQAGETAAEGKFVVAAHQAQPHGHVAVVVDYRNVFASYTPVDRDKAVAFWGNLNSVGGQYARITQSFDLQHVLFAYRPIA